MEKFTAYLGFFMGAFFIFMGVFLPLKPPPALAELTPFFRVLLGVLLVAYGIFRVYRAYKVVRPNQ
ncbi:MAG: hypothetical protein D6722_07035 [Bacteroidetes bacterium]|nr:MAG: hypothetical protein D6722_07035 [Bacteroidota bacterium]